jgi:phosphoribosyl 1,2-cyclic phosphodiesterase
MRFASLGSGSEGNGLVVESGGTRVLIDCGFGVRGAEKRLARLKIEPSSINAILVTHEHSDHVGGVPAFAARHGIKVRATRATIDAVTERFKRVNIPVNATHFESHCDPFKIGTLEIMPVTVPHDACEPVQYVINDGTHRLGVLTDIGESTRHVEECYSGCDALVLECNHDLEMLQQGRYPKPLQDRIRGPRGHLSNAAAADILTSIDTSRLKHIVAAHLSQQNNTEELAQTALSEALGWSREQIVIAKQDEGFGWIEM